MWPSTRAGVLPPARPVVWPLRPAQSAHTTVEILPDGRRRILIRHADLRGVTPEMLAWWFAHVEGEMEYAGRRWPRYLVWHPLDHIAYEVVKRTPEGDVGPGARLHVREAFQRNPRTLLDTIVDVERIDAEAAIISRSVHRQRILGLVNTFERTPTGTRYVSEMTIGMANVAGSLGVNRALRALILGGPTALAWARHHIEEVGNLEHFLPGLFASEA